MTLAGCRSGIHIVLAVGAARRRCQRPASSWTTTRSAERITTGAVKNPARTPYLLFHRAARSSRQGLGSARISAERVLDVGEHRAPSSRGPSGARPRSAWPVRARSDGAVRDTCGRSCAAQRLSASAAVALDVGVRLRTPALLAARFQSSPRDPSVRFRRCCRRPAIALASHGKPMSLARCPSGCALPNGYGIQATPGGPHVHSPLRGRAVRYRQADEPTEITQLPVDRGTRSVLHRCTPRFTLTASPATPDQPPTPPIQSVAITSPYCMMSIGSPRAPVSTNVR